MNGIKVENEPIKAVFLDIDGTLLNPDHELTDINIRTVKSLGLDLGIPVFLISARPPSGIWDYYTLLGLKTPFSAYNGSLIGSFEGPYNYVAERNLTISLPYIEDIVLEASRFPFTLCVYRGNTLYVEDPNNFHAQREHRLTHCEVSKLDLETFLPYCQGEGMGPHKIQCIGPYEEVKPFVEIILAKEYAHTLNMSRSGEINFEITQLEGTKENAVSYLTHHHQIPIKQVMAIGDNYNDINTLNMVGIGIAMGNAPSEILSKVKLHTTKNTENGVAMAIKKYFPEISIHI